MPPRKLGRCRAVAAVIVSGGMPVGVQSSCGYQTATRRRLEGEMKPISSINFGVIHSASVVTARTAARVTIATISPRMPSPAVRIF